MPSKQPPSAVRSFTWRGALMPAPASVRSPSRLMPLIVLAACYAPCANAALVARWPLDEGQGDLFRDVVGDNDGFLPQDAEIEWVNDGPAGIQNASVLFSGDLGPSYIETPFPGIGGADPRTVTLWVKADPQPFNTAMVAWGSLENGRKWHFRINQGTNSLRTEFMGGQNFAETDMADGQWHFVASVFPEGATEGLEIEHYLDAQFDPQLGGTSRAIDTATGDDDGGFNVHIGWAAGHPNRFFVGQIADVRIYDEALDEERLAKIMAGEEIGPGVLGDFDGDGQLTVSDINTLAAALRTPNPEQRFDVNGDGSVTLADHAFWASPLLTSMFGSRI